MSKHTIFITGATSGIGFEMAKQFAEAGHEVISLGRNVDRLKDVSDLSPNIVSRKFDVGEIPKIDSFISSLFEEFPQIDIVQPPCYVPLIFAFSTKASGTGGRIPKA